jgi:hypothetical protein
MTDRLDLILRLTHALAERFTVAEHLALRNERERLGYCSHRRCAPGCLEKSALLDEALAYLEAEAARLEAEPQLQPDLFAGTG